MAPKSHHACHLYQNGYVDRLGRPWDKRGVELTREQLSIIYDNTSDLIFMIGVEGVDDYRVISVNRTYLARAGVRPEQLVNQRLQDIFPVEEHRYLLEKYGQAVAGDTVHYETKTSLGGQACYLDTMLVPVFEERSCRYIVGVSRDITETKLERKALAREKARAENYLDIARAVIVVTDLEQRIVTVNRRGHELLGYPEGSLVGRSFLEFVDSERVGAIRDGLRDAIAAGRTPGETALWVRTAEDGRRLILWSASILYDEDGQPTGTLGSGEDITERHRAAKTMIASQRVMAAGEVVSAVAHDFNNALQGILGNVELALMDERVDGKLESFLQTARELANDAAQRIVQLQKLGNPDAAEASDVVDIHTLILEVIDQTRLLWRDEAERQGGHVVIDTHFASGESLVPGVETELQSLLYSVVKNAIEAVSGSGHIDISTTRHAETFEIVVRDDGVGMDESTSTRMFQPFYSTKGYEVGRGLGMSNAHTVARAHGGEVRLLESAPGKGTAIEIILPLQAADVGEVFTSTGPRVLWVDDDPAIRELASHFLETLGYEGDVVASGSEALTLVHERDYALAVTDIGMPDMSGFELASEIGVATDSRVPVVALTGWGETVTAADQEATGISRVLAKPIRMQDLKEILDRIVAG